MSRLVGPPARAQTAAAGSARIPGGGAPPPGGAIPADETNDHPLHRWLNARLAGQLDPAAPAPAAAPDLTQPIPNAAKPSSAPQRVLGTGAAGRPPEPLYPVYLDPDDERVDDAATEMVEDPATVLAERRTPSPKLAVDAEDDPATVQHARMPALGFIGESVMDPLTVQDHRPEATRWREETQARIDEIPPGPLPGTMDRSQPTLARELSRAPARPRAPEPVAEEEDDDEGEFDRHAIWVGLVIGAVSGFVAVLVFVAWFAGRV